MTAEEKEQTLDLSKTKVPTGMLVGIGGALIAGLTFIANFLFATKSDVAHATSLVQEARWESAQEINSLRLEVRSVTADVREGRLYQDAMRMTIDDIAKAQNILPSTARIVVTSTRSP